MTTQISNKLSNKSSLASWSTAVDRLRNILSKNIYILYPLNVNLGKVRKILKTIPDHLIVQGKCSPFGSNNPRRGKPKLFSKCEWSRKIYKLEKVREQEKQSVTHNNYPWHKECDPNTAYVPKELVMAIIMKHGETKRKSAGSGGRASVTPILGS